MSELDDKIIAEGAKVRALAHKGALEARKATLLVELKAIETQLETDFKNIVADVKEDVETVVTEVEKDLGINQAPAAAETPVKESVSPEIPADETPANGKTKTTK